MKKIIIPILMASIIASTPAPASSLIADNTETEMPAQDDSENEDQDSAPEEEGISIYSPPQEATTAEETSSDEEEEGTPVGQASNEGARAARNRQWRNIALAVAAVAVAVTALLLVASNDGRHHKHKHDDK